MVAVIPADVAYAEREGYARVLRDFGVGGLRVNVQVKCLHPYTTRIISPRARTSSADGYSGNSTPPTTEARDETDRRRSEPREAGWRETAGA